MSDKTGYTVYFETLIQASSTSSYKFVLSNIIYDGDGKAVDIIFNAKNFFNWYYEKKALSESFTFYFTGVGDTSNKNNEVTTGEKFYVSAGANFPEVMTGSVTYEIGAILI